MLPTADTNLCGTRIKPVTDLSLSMVVAASATVNGTAFTTGLPATVVFLTQLSSGSGTLNIRVDDTAAHALANIGSPTSSISMSGTTKLFTTVDTSDSALNDATLTSSDAGWLNTSDLWVQVQEVAPNTNGFELSLFTILVLFELRGGEDWYSIRAGGLNAVAGTVGAGATVGVNNSTYVAGYQDGAGNLYLSET